MKLIRPFIVPALFCASHASVCAAASPNPNDPALISAFFDFNNSFSRALASRAATAGQSAPIAAQQLFGMDAASVASLNNVTASVSAAREQIRSAMGAYMARTMAAHQNPDGPTVLSFQSQERQTVAAGWLSLQQSISPTAWSALRSFVNGDFRGHVQVHTLGAVNGAH